MPKYLDRLEYEKETVYVDPTKLEYLRSKLDDSDLDIDTVVNDRLHYNDRFMQDAQA